MGPSWYQGLCVKHCDLARKTMKKINAILRKFTPHFLYVQYLTQIHANFTQYHFSENYPKCMFFGSLVSETTFGHNSVELQANVELEWLVSALLVDPNTGSGNTVCMVRRCNKYLHNHGIIWSLSQTKACGRTSWIIFANGQFTYEPLSGLQWLLGHTSSMAKDSTQSTTWWCHSRIFTSYMSQPCCLPNLKILKNYCPKTYPST